MASLRRRVKRLDGADHKPAIRACSAEQGHVVTGRGHDVRSAGELTDAVIPDAGLKRSWEQRDDLALGRLQPSSGCVDAKDAAPNARGPGRVRGPALLAPAEQIGSERAASRPEKQETQGDGEAAPSE